MGFREVTEEELARLEPVESTQSAGLREVTPEELERLQPTTTYGLGPRPEDSILRAPLRGIQEAPRSIIEIPKALGTLTGQAASLTPAGKLYQKRTLDPRKIEYNREDLQTAENVARGTGSVASAIAGAGAGAKGGAMVGGGIGTLIGTPGIGTGVGAGIGGGIGAILGGAAGLLGFNYLNRAVGNDPPVSAREDVKNLLYDITQGATLVGAGKLTKSGYNRAIKEPAVRIKRAAVPDVERTALENAQNTLKENVNIDVLAKKLNELPDNELSPYISVAEKTQDPGLAGLARTLAKQQQLPLQDILESLNNQRTAAKQSILNKSLGKKINPEEAGELIRRELEKGKKKAFFKTREAYEKAGEADGVLPTFSAKTEVADLFADINRLRQPITSEAEKLYKDFTTAPNHLPIDELDQFKRRAADIIRKYYQQAQPSEITEASYKLANTLSKQITKIEEAAIDAPLGKRRVLPSGQKVGLLKKDRGKLQEAREAHKAEGKAYRVGASKDILKWEGYDTYKKTGEQAAKIAIRNPKSARQVLKNIKGTPAEVAFRRRLANELFKSADSLEELTPYKFVERKRAIDDIIAELDQPNTKKALDLLEADYQSMQDFAKLKRGASKGQSITAQELTAMEALSAATKTLAFGKLGPLSRLLEIPAKALNRKRLELIGNRANNILMELLLDEDFARKFVNDVKNNRYDYIAERIVKHAYKPTGLEVLGRTSDPLQTVEEDDQESFFLPNEEQPTIEAPEQMINNEITDPLLDAVRQVESGGGKYLKSSAGALGPYQFMPATARAYNLDDPFDEDESRRAARELLIDELEALGSLELALAAYNAGRGRITEAIKRAGSREWDAVKRFLPKETREYVPKVFKSMKV